MLTHLNSQPWSTPLQRSVAGKQTKGYPIQDGLGTALPWRWDRT